MNIRAWRNTLSATLHTLPIVILYVTEGCNLKCQMCLYRNPLPNELTLSDIGILANDLQRYGLQHIVYSGGEPLLRRDFPLICELFGQLHVKQTLLTNGLLLEKRLEELPPDMSEIVISLDGATAETHNAIRGIESFEKIVDGIRKAVSRFGRNKVSIRSVVQKSNFRELMNMVTLAESLGVGRISFLAVDVLSDSFGRSASTATQSQSAIMLDNHETNIFRNIVEQLIVEKASLFAKRFVSESPDKLRHIVKYFEALNGTSEFPRNFCNAPMVSAVITSTGSVQPCFFLGPYGSLQESALTALLNSSDAHSTRRAVSEYSLERCKTCVCTLHIRPVQALANRF